MNDTSVYWGTSGLLIDIPKRDFPDELKHLSRLGFYSLQQNSIEVNSTFYKLPQPKTVARWAAEVPNGFRFTFKLWQAITHQPRLDFKASDIGNFFNAVNGAKHCGGCILVQFPPSLTINASPQLKALLKNLSNQGWRIVVEFRHSSWYKDETYELLYDSNVALVIHDMPGSATPIEFTTDDLVYLRFHGPEGKYKGSYTNDTLSEYAQYIREWQEEKKTVYVYFNNTAGDALVNLHTLKQMITV